MFKLLRYSLVRHASTARFSSSTAKLQTLRPKIRGRNVFLTATGFALSLSFYTSSQAPVYSESPYSSPSNGFSELHTLTSSLRTYLVYTMCSIPTLVDYAPSVLEFLLQIPIIRTVTEAGVRRTFFQQFVGGDTAEDCLPLLQRYRAAGMGALFAYSVEVDERAHGAGAGEAYKMAVNEMLHSIDVAADFEDSFKSDGRKTWVAIKLTALLRDSTSLINLSRLIAERHQNSKALVPFPGTPTHSDLSFIHSGSLTLSKDDKESLSELFHDMRRICSKAKARGVTIIVDAEYSWYQPAVDAITLALMKEFNGEGKAWVYNTYQAYLRRTPEHLEHSLADARKNNFTLGVKLVRGAYHPHEIDAFENPSSHSISTDVDAPVWRTKQVTDECYNACAQTLLSDVTSKHSAVDVLFGTHNWTSVRKILDTLVSSGLATRQGEAVDGIVSLSDRAVKKVTMAQLYGMHDDLTEWIVEHTQLSSKAPFVIKYVPYGRLSEVMPYLGRRAIENKSVLGGGVASEERRKAGIRIRKVLFG